MPSPIQPAYKGPDDWGYQYDQAQAEMAPEPNEDMYVNLNYILYAVDSMRRPLGTRSAPGRSCEHIRRHSSNRDLKNGDYYIDPSFGAFAPMLVYCRFHTDYAETCLQNTDKFEERRWFESSMTSAWFVEHVTGKELDYNARSSQLTLLQRQSDIATQTVTFRCLNVKTQGFQFLPNDENTAYIDTSSSRYLSSTRIEKSEDCDTNNQWGKSTYIIRTKRPQVLPITDILVYDVGAENQQLGVNVGEVCFRNEV